MLVPYSSVQDAGHRVSVVISEMFPQPVQRERTRSSSRAVIVNGPQDREAWS